jgi:hypothetical protein
MSRSHETVIDLKATPEEVFRAITDPEQIVQWFCDEARVDPRVGGEYYFAWGGMGATTTIIAWEPGKHFGTQSERSKTYGHKGPVDTGVVQKMCVDTTSKRWAEESRAFVWFSPASAPKQPGTTSSPTRNPAGATS